MADNEHPPPGPDDRTPPSGVPAQPGGDLSVRPPSPPAPAPATPPPPPIDPEAVRQFQQFQQFQELMRRQQEEGFPQGTPPPPGFLQPWGQPPPRPPWWKRALKTVGGKLVTLAVVALLVAAGAFWLINKLPGSGPPQSPGKPHDVGGKKAETNLIYATDPRSAVQKVYDDVAQHDATSACGRFMPDARAQFVDHFASLGSSCEQVVAALSKQITPGQKSEYANPRFPSAMHLDPASGSAQVSSCALEVTGGPRLGLLTVSRLTGSIDGQWIVTRHDAEPADCAGTSVTPTR